MTSSLIAVGYKQSYLDHSLFTYSFGFVYVVLVVYVNDILIVGTDMPTIQALKDLLHHQFTIKDLGPVKYYLGLEFQRNTDGIFLSQQKFITDLLTAANML